MRGSKGLRFVALRYFNACGAHKSGAIGEAHNPETHLVPLILQVPNGQRAKISVFGDDYDTKDGTCIRDYIHVTDLAQAHILALDYLMKGGDNDVFNLGNGVGFTVNEVIDCARRVTGHPIPADLDRPGVGAAGAGHDLDLDRHVQLLCQLLEPFRQRPGRS